MEKPQILCEGWLKLHPEDGQLPLGAGPKCRYHGPLKRSNFSKWIEIS